MSDIVGMEREADFLIVGLGFAGAALAKALLGKGCSVRVIDDEDQVASSRRAAGLISSLAGKGMNPAWRQAEYLPEAVAYYRELEQKHNCKLLYDFPIFRPFDNEAQKTKFLKKQEKIAEWGRLEQQPPSAVHAEHGGFTMLQSGRLDPNVYLDVIKKELAECYSTGKFDEEDIEFLDDSVKWNGMEFGKIILCAGYYGLNGKFFGHIHHRSAKGEMFTVRMPDFPQKTGVSRNGWLVPLGEGLWRAGATYEWDDLDCEPSEWGEQEVRKKIEALVDLPYEVVDHNAGIRPIIRNSQPVIGFHPEHPQLAIFNGLGSKGVITAPSVASHFSEVLVNGAEIDPELDLANLKPKKQ